MKKIFVLGLFVLASMIVRAQHTVIMKSGERMSGTVQSMKDGMISFTYKGNEMKLKLSDVSAVYFEDKPMQQEKTSNNMSSNAIKEVSKPAAKEPGEKTIMSGSYMVRYKCGTRTIVKPPVISNLQEDKGTVVVDISIDKYGHVLKASPGADGTTTDSDYLRTKAKQAAESAMFDNVPTAPLQTTGYIIIKY